MRSNVHWKQQNISSMKRHYTKQKLPPRFCGLPYFKMNKITDNIWLGDIMDAQHGDTSIFDAVVTVCQDGVSDNVSCVYHHFPLSDGPPEEESHNPGTFEFGVFEQAVDTVIDHVERDYDIFVHCHVGRSRSVVVVATAIAEMQGIDIYEALEMVREGRSRINPKPEIIQYGRRYLGG